LNSIETIACLILLFMGVPEFCARIARPSMASSLFVLFGLLLGPLVTNEVQATLLEVGKIGFLLVLFEVGAEINLPRLRRFFRPLRLAVVWSFLQFPLIMLIASRAGLSLPETLLIAAALTGCSMSMAYPGWKNYVGLTPGARPLVLQIMVALEMVTMVLLAVGTPAVVHGLKWIILGKVAGIAVTIYLISRFSSHLTDLFELIVRTTSRWRVNFILLLVLGVSAIGERLGLSGAKTAFFLGLFMSRARYDQMNVEEYMAPVSRRFLIPLFFVSLGMSIKLNSLIQWTSLLAIATAFLLLGLREAIHRRWFQRFGSDRAFLLFCPNLTMGALAANSLLEDGRQAAASWAIICSLVLTVTSLWMLPRAQNVPADNTAKPREELEPHEAPV
jgi:Kef-type K+ transport system membrane component KefB